MFFIEIILGFNAVLNFIPACSLSELFIHEFYSYHAMEELLFFISFMHKTLLFAPLVLMILALGFSIYLFFTYSNIILSGNISEKYNTYSLIANIIYLTQIGFIFKWFTYSLLSTIKNVVFSNKSNVIGITQSKFFIGEMSIFGIINMVFIYLMYEILSKFTTGG